jgi:hypothetical protein
VKRRSAAVILLLVLGLTVHVGAWGAEGHRLILDRAIDLLPPELRATFAKNRASLIEHASDPDLWRVVGFDDEAPRHFLDMDAYGRYPFPDLPRDFDAAVQRYGRDMVTKNGLLPWRVADIYARLVRAFEAHRTGSPYGLSNALYLSSVLSHYVADAHQPFHAVLNYDGQLTGQAGIHARFEDALVVRYRAQLTFSPAAPTSIAQPRDAMFDTLLASTKLVDSLLNADRRAVGSRTEYDDGYFDAFFADAKPVVERRMSDAMTLVAGIIVGAWQQAGKPDVSTPIPRTVQKVRRIAGR